ncbi:MAG: bifunctional folylpolyglutamate synthase/dihydrofolate synthase [candidate division Zixibacteria bacterium]|nr:bifunctional folylpolyglutamate synthase/dihydrofolate synthase [candidate division Zixibacteria bacterium]
MTYQETLDFLFAIEKYGIFLGLERIKAYMDILGNPQNSYPSIHVAGTNGKGSTAAILQSVLTNAGYKVGLLTSPHLVNFAERMRIGYKDCDPDYIVDFVEANKKRMERIPVSFFEITTALAFQYFADEKVDIAVVEVGMGGRLDATNVLRPEVSVITNIDYDHTKSLGNTLEAIAVEKAGIVKEGIPCITASRYDNVKRTIREICEKRRSDFISAHDDFRWASGDSSLLGSDFNAQLNGNSYEKIHINLAGEHQVENAVTAIAALNLVSKKGFNIDNKAIYDGMKNVKWLGRLQVVSENPMVLLDVAHNPAGAAFLEKCIHKFLPKKKIIAVLGILSDKKRDDMLKRFKSFADLLILTKPVSERAVEPEFMAEKAAELEIPFEIIHNVNQAYQRALDLANPEDVVLVTGSHYTVGEAILSLDETRRYR